MTDWDAETIEAEFLNFTRDIPGVLDVRVSEIRYFRVETVVEDRREHADAVYGAEWEFSRANPDLPPHEFRVIGRAAGKTVAVAGVVDELT